MKNDLDFLDHPEAQEQAMTDALRVYHAQARALGLDRYVGQVITGLDGAEVRVTQAGVVAAAHRVGVQGVADSLGRITTGKKPTTKRDFETDTFVRKRLREFQSIIYESHE